MTDIPQHAPRRRLTEIDIMKGLLLLMMLVYHNVAAADSNAIDIIQRKLPVISYAFLLMCGLVAGLHYGPDRLTNGRHACRRLRRHAFKLSVLFVLLNAVLYSAGVLRVEALRPLLALGGFVEHLLLEVDGAIFTCEVLLYLAAFLFLGSFCISFGAAAAICAASFAVVSCLPAESCHFIAFGFGGLALGMFLSPPRFATVVNLCRQYGYIAVALLIAWVWIKTGKISLPVQTLSAALNCAEFLAWGAGAIWLCRASRISGLPSGLAFLGRYTLFGYLFQLPVILCVDRITDSYLDAGEWLSFGVNLLASSTATILAIVALDRLRAKSRLVEKGYAFVFK